MNYIKPIEEFLFEGKQVGVVYHYTSISNLVKILDTNSLRGSILPPQHFQFSEYDLEDGDYEIEKLDNYYSQLKNKILSNRCISLTRDKLFHLQSRTPNIDCRLVLDGGMLSNNYEIIPYQYVAHYGKNMEDIGDEQEELLIIKKGTSVNDIRKYIISVDIINKGELYNKQLLSYLSIQGLNIFDDLLNFKSGIAMRNEILKRFETNKDSISQILDMKINY